MTHRNRINHGAMSIIMVVLCVATPGSAEAELRTPGGLWFLGAYNCKIGTTATAFTIREAYPGERFCVRGDCAFEPGYVADQTIGNATIPTPLSGWGASSITMIDDAQNVFRLDRTGSGSAMSGTATIDGFTESMTCNRPFTLGRFKSQRVR